MNAHEIYKLPATGTWPETPHQFDQQSIDAITTACYSQRPLLIRGETGSGKSQLARAVAHVWGRLFVSEVVHSRSESRDLHYHFDALARLADAQAAGAFIKDKADAEAYLKPEKYLSPGALWWVFDWTTAQQVYKDSEHKQKMIIHPMIRDAAGNERKWETADGAVILIDEIDKAETDLPNDLLETLGNGAFTVPWRDEPVRMQSQNPPLVVITTNDERELPAAFVRRCVVLHLNPPQDSGELKDWLCQRGRVHFGALFDAAFDEQHTIYQKAAELLIKNRRRASDKGVPLVGQAEYIDLLRALSKHPPETWAKALITISPYVYKKYPEMVG